METRAISSCLRAAREIISALLREAFNIDDLKLSREKRSRVDGEVGHFPAFGDGE
jgi:hypothetical protein